MQDKFYKKNWFIWLMIIFIFPLGLFLLFILRGAGGAV